MQKGLDWRLYVDANGDFELAHYLYKTISYLMKTSLDLGTLLSDDQAKLRAYKEQVKSTFKDRWLDVAKAFEEFDIIVPCGCKHTTFCSECGGSRYKINEMLTADTIREISFVTAAGDIETTKKLNAGLEKAISETASYT